MKLLDKELTHSLQHPSNAQKGKRACGYYVTYALCYMFVGLFLAWVSHHFIVDEVLKRLASKLASPAVAWVFYPASEDAQRKEKITVLAMDDDDLVEFKQTYPVPYSFHAQRLNSISLYPPKSIFIDIWFHDKRDDASITQFVDAICNLHKNGTRVYLATLSPDGTDATALRPELDAITAAAKGPSSIDNKPGACAVAVAVDKDVDSLDRQSWKYDLVGGVDDNKIFSAAAQIYGDMSGHNSFTLSSTPPLALIWGVKGAEINEKAIGSSPDEQRICRNEWYWIEILPLPAAFKSTIHHSFSSFVSYASGGLLSFSTEIDKPFCAYHATLPFRALKLLPPEITAPLLNDRLIIYGGNLQSMDDVVYSPVHGRLAGLHMHAMALDNLLNYKEDYPKAGEFGHSYAATTFSLFVVAILSLIMTLFRRYQDGRPELSNETSSAIDTKQKWYVYWGISKFFKWILSWTKKVLLSVCMLSIMAWLGLELFHLGPLSWMEYAAAPVVMHLLHVGENMTEYIYPKFSDAHKKFKTYFAK